MRVWYQEIIMTTTKSLTKPLIVAALLSTFAAVSFAQAPITPEGPHRMHEHRHHHKHHGHHHHHRHHALHNGTPGNR
jgi:Spy/CpxP family protein refolding chaperone